MPDNTNMGTIAKGVTDLARDAAYVAVGLGVLGYQRAQVQRNELKNLLPKDFSLDEHLCGVRTELTKGVTAARRPSGDRHAVHRDQHSAAGAAAPPDRSRS